MFFHPVKQSRFGWNVKFNHCDMLRIGFQFQRQSKHLTTGILGMKIGMYLLRLGHSLALLDWRMIYSIGLCMVDVDLLTYGLGLWQVLIKLPAAFGLCMSMENILAGSSPFQDNRTTGWGLQNSVQLPYKWLNFGLC